MQISRIEINSVKFPELKIALLTDIHNTPCDDVIKALTEEKPDIIAIAGDLTDYRLYPDSRTLVLLKKFSNIAKVFYSLGNHEATFGANDRRLIFSTGAVLLDNEYCEYRGIYIGGLRTGFDGIRGHCGRPPKTDWLDGFEKLPGVKLLLCHHPEYYEKYLKGRDIDLILSGHAHGGQIRIFNRGLFSPSQGIFPKYTKGIYDNKLIVSAGLANTTYIPRLNNPRQLVFVETGK